MFIPKLLKYRLWDASYMDNWDYVYIIPYRSMFWFCVDYII